MAAHIAADAVVVIHFAFIAFVLIGGFLAWKWLRIAAVHVPCAAWGVMIEFRGWICPLTPLENALRQAAGDPGYSGGFIDRYIASLIYPEGLTPRMQVYLGIAVLALNLCAYSVLLTLRMKKRTQRA
jgi:hypothetical protein